MTKGKPEGLAEVLARGQKAAERLAPATDKLTETIAQIERSLSELRLGVSGSVEVSSDDEYSDQGQYQYSEFVQLAFRKEAKTWRLMVDSGVSGEPDTYSSVPLVNASRELRMLAVDHLPELVGELVKEAEQRIAEVEAKQATAEAMLDTLKRRGGGAP